MDGVSDFQCCNIDDEMIGHMFRFALDRKRMLDDLESATFLHAGTLARKSYRYFKLNDFISREKLKVSMNNSICYRMKLNILDKRDKGRTHGNYCIGSRTSYYQKERS